MLSDGLDIIIEGRGGAIWLILAGPFHEEQMPNMREKFTALLEDGNRSFVVDLEKVTVMGPQVPRLFLTILNDVRGKGGEIRFVFRNERVSTAFGPYQNLFLIFPDTTLLKTEGLWKRIFRPGSRISKRTGIRLSRRVAFFLLFVLGGWFLSLFFIIYLQNQRIAGQQKEIAALNEWKQRSSIELTSLRERLKPLEQLGILRDANGK